VKEPFTLEWVKAFRQHASPQLGALALFMFVTGARVSEALRVQWDDLDFKPRPSSSTRPRSAKVG
jgi:integrase